MQATLIVVASSPHFNRHCLATVGAVNGPLQGWTYSSRILSWLRMGSAHQPQCHLHTSAIKCRQPECPMLFIRLVYVWCMHTHVHTYIYRHMGTTQDKPDLGRIERTAQRLACGCLQNKATARIWFMKSIYHKQSTVSHFSSALKTSH